MTVLYVTGFFWGLMSAHLVILGRVIPSSPPMDMNQCRYTNFYKSHPLILNYHGKVSGYGPSNFGPSWSFLWVFFEFPKIKSSPKTEVSQITKYLNISPILTSHNDIQKIIASKTCFC